MREKDPPPDHLRCKRTDGRQWRCKRRAMDGKMLCDIHHLQGKHRQNKQKVPESLKLERKVTKKKRINEGETSTAPRVSKLTKVKPLEKTRRMSEALDEALKRMKLKKGDLHLELIRVFLKRQVEKKKEKELKENAIADQTEEFQLPYGVMAISQSPLKQNNDGLDVKIGVECNGHSFLQRDFRSKNIEPLPFGTMQVVPFADIVKKKRVKKCHWCRESKNRCFVKCLTCRKRFFCVECIKDRNFEKQEVKMKCPACHGTCSCTLCKTQKYGTNNDKECSTSEKKLDRIQSLQYIIHLLLPVLKQLNRDQSIELETEAKITGQKQPEIQIPQTKAGLHTSLSCNRCKTSIVDYHRTCTKCSYNLCLSCCRELSRHVLYESFKLKSCKKRKLSPDEEKLFKPNLLSQDSLQNWEVRPDGSIPCPPIRIGGCGEALLDLTSTFPFTLNADLEVRAEEIMCSYDFPESADISLPCSLCNGIDSRNGEVIKPLRIGFSENYLYCPTLKDLRQETLDHFQNHWSKGHPVIVRNMLRSTSSLCWDPIIMFCSYMESKSCGSCNESKMKASLDWCEVEINRKRIFMGSLEKRTHASVKQKFLKFRVCLSSQLFGKQFPIHYNEILSALPLKEYIHPASGLLNVGVKLPKESRDLGPCIYFSYGGPDELSQADFLSKLCYDAHDTVNILAYATDVPASPEQISTVENLLKKQKGQNHQGQTFSNSSDQKGKKSSLQSEDTGESGLQDVGEKTNLPNGIKNIEGQTLRVGNGNLSEDSDSDSDASILFSGSIENSEDVDEFFQGEDIESSIDSEEKRVSACGAQWDIFHRQDVPKLLEYLKRHSTELTPACSYTKLVHPILDRNYFLDTYHKLKLKQEFDIEPWSFEQCAGEAIFIPAGCPYQVRKLKSCVNVVLEFMSPENVVQCIQLRDEIHALPTWHKAKGTLLEVEKMALYGISAAVDDFRDLAHLEQGQKVASAASSRSKDRRLFEGWLKQHNSKLTITPRRRQQQQQQQQQQQPTSSRRRRPIQDNKVANIQSRWNSPTEYQQT